MGFMSEVVVVEELVCEDDEVGLVDSSSGVVCVMVEDSELLVNELLVNELVVDELVVDELVATELSLVDDSLAAVDSDVALVDPVVAEVATLESVVELKSEVAVALPSASVEVLSSLTSRAYTVVYQTSVVVWVLV